jgi:3-hydroxyisobutyrate dehydrogenase
MKIAFVGLGNMGAPMARNLLRHGHSLVVFDVVQRNVDALIAAGAMAATSVRAAAATAELVITMLPSSPHVKTVYLGDDGVLAAAAVAHGNPMADAPVSGGTGGAETATLTFMVGAEPAVFDRIKPLLAQMGKNIVYCGNSGTGQVAKICNNMLLGISMIGVAEAMNLGAALGIEPKILAGVINTSSGRCWSSDTYNPYPGVLDNAPAARGYSGGFGTDLMLKDLGLATDAAKQAKQPVTLGAAAQQLYQIWSAHGAGGQDFSSIINLLKGCE